MDRVNSVVVDFPTVKKHLKKLMKVDNYIVSKRYRSPLTLIRNSLKEKNHEKEREKG
jgi:hypothetical protein